MENHCDLASVEDTVSFDIGGDNTVTVSNQGICVSGSTIVEATPERISNGAVDIEKNRASGTTPIVEYYVAQIGGTGLELWRLTQEAQFRYTGTSAEVNYKDGYYKRGTLSMWQVSNWNPNQVTSLKNSDGDWTKEVRSTATFHWGVEFNGSGLVIEEKNAYAYARCTVYGRVYGDAGSK